MNFKNKKTIITLLSLILFIGQIKAVVSKNENPVIGAQVIIEKGQSKQEIEELFQVLSESNMQICRIRMFESYMKDKEGKWDFTLFDYAFRAAEKYDIKIFATLFPFTNFDDIGGFKFPSSIEHKKLITEYIRQVVMHFAKYNSLYAWVLINEPGVGSAPLQETYTQQKFKDWKLNYTPIINRFDPRPSMSFLKERFLLDYNTSHLNWIAQEIKAIDPNRHLHVNNHAIFTNYGEYNFPKWRLFLNSLGGSAHASWHFGLFPRKHYHYAMSINSEIIKSGAGNLPWMMTELQGGNNIWSGFNPMCPTKEEIEQWMWTIIGTGSKGLIFWSLNARASGLEAGEWAMLNQLNRPTDRLQKAAEISNVIQTRPDLFKEATVAESGVTLLYTRESLWTESKSVLSGQSLKEREVGACIKSIIGFYETLSQLGIQVNIQSIDEYNFSEKNNGKVIILAHQIALPINYRSSLENFVSTGGTLIVEGLSGYFDDQMRTQTGKYANFADLFGGKIKDIKLIASSFQTIIDSSLVLPTAIWETTILPNEKTEALATNGNGDIIMTSSKFGDGNVFWIPACIGQAAYMSANYRPLSKFAEKYIRPYLPSKTIQFRSFSEDLLMKTLKTNSGYVVILINKSDSVKEFDVIIPSATAIKLLNKSSDSFIKGKTHYLVNPEETLVIEYQND